MNLIKWSILVPRTKISRTKIPVTVPYAIYTATMRIEHHHNTRNKRHINIEIIYNNNNNSNSMMAGYNFINYGVGLIFVVVFFCLRFITITIIIITYCIIIITYCIIIIITYYIIIIA